MQKEISLLKDRAKEVDSSYRNAEGRLELLRAESQKWQEENRFLKTKLLQFARAAACLHKKTLSTDIALQDIAKVIYRIAEESPMVRAPPSLSAG